MIIVHSSYDPIRQYRRSLVILEIHNIFIFYSIIMILIAFLNPFANTHVLDLITKPMLKVPKLFIQSLLGAHILYNTILRSDGYY
jgi:uncharacterized protein YybS (DUF2232 family)